MKLTKQNTPTYRAKSKEQKNTYVEGLLIGVDVETDLCTIRTKDDYIGGEICYLHTLSINFSDMLSQGNKIFASLQKDGRGGDILISTKYKYVLSFDGFKFNLQRLYSQTSFDELDRWENFEIIGIKE